MKGIRRTFHPSPIEESDVVPGVRQGGDDERVSRISVLLVELRQGPVVVIIVTPLCGQVVGRARGCGRAGYAVTV